MSSDITIAVDAMGGDFGPSEIIPAIKYSVEKHEQLNIILVGKENLILEQLKKNNIKNNNRINISHASEIIGMDESPSQALRNKKESSMRIAIELVRDGNAKACVSAGNTGALMATSRFILKMLPGMDRPAICTTLPGKKDDTHILDLGANVDSSSEQLFQFAIMGAQLTSAVKNKDNPTIALLNIGEEEIKGNDRVKQAAKLLEESHLNYVGYIEADKLYSGDVDVIVCDGFVGNVAIKASEGVADFLLYHVKKEFKSNLYSKFAALIAIPVLKSLRYKIDPKQYNGASLLGLRGIVVKSHGGARRISFARAIDEAIIEIKNNIPEKINKKLEQLIINR